MKNLRSFATFTDGHEEDILYYEIRVRHVLFVTKSGIYIFAREVEMERVFNVWKRTKNAFYKINNGIKYEYPELSVDRVEYIKSITIDERIEYKYTIGFNGSGEYFSGTVLVPKNSSEDQIKLAILNEATSFNYEKKEG